MNKVAALIGEPITRKQAVVPPREPSVPSQHSAPAETYLDMILKAARDPSVDITKMERLMALRERMISTEAEKAFNEAMRATQAALPRVFRNKDGDKKTRYADLEAIDIASRPIITEHGFSESYGTADSPLDKHYRVTCILSHVAGYSRSYHADIPTDMFGPQGAAVKTAIHGFGSAMSYGRRYLKCLIFNIVLTNEDDDGKAAGGKEPESALITPEQVATIRQEMNDRGILEAAFCKFAGYPLEEMPSVDFATALRNVRLKKKAS